MDRRCRGIGGSRRRVADDDARRTATSRGGREGAQEDAGGHREGETPAEEVTARIAFETKSATFAEKHAAMVGHTLEALRKSGDEHPFARVQYDHAHVNGTVKRI